MAEPQARLSASLWCEAVADPGEKITQRVGVLMADHMARPAGAVGQERRTGAGPGIACAVVGSGSAVARRTGLGHLAFGAVIVGFAVVTVVVGTVIRIR
ncbi:hypothetical protein [Streptomyces sp. MA5143a]|uniref:hypothetical protein n=1 Tax=Streptomyces sp. MA5143a TaxID=2083010 RepID=UPI000D1BA922|nr:hypothetical protein [Streptomyces sp. MA5143a]